MTSKSKQRLFFFMFVLLLAFLMAGTNTYAANYAEYFPLDTSTRIYVTTVGSQDEMGKIYMNRIIGTELINGTQTTKIGVFPYALIFSPDTYDSFYNITNDGTTVKIWGNQSFTLSSPISSETLNDGDIIPAVNLSVIDRATQTPRDVEMSANLIDIRNIIVSGVTYPDSLIMFTIDQAYLVKEVNFGFNTLGFPATYLPNSNSPLPGALTRFDIYAKGVGLIANGDIDADTGDFGALIELKSVNKCAAALSSDFILHIPIINYNSGALYLWADFRYEPTNDGNIMFKVNDAGYANPADYDNCQASTLTPDLKIHIPMVPFDTMSLWVNFEYMPTVDGLIWFKVTDALEN